MLSIRLVLCFILIVLVQAEANAYTRGEKVNPASRVVNGESTTGSSNNDVLEFHSVKKVSGIQPGYVLRNRKQQP